MDNKKKQRKERKRKLVVRYTHKDASGMLWRYVKGRPVSMLADQTLAGLF